MVRLLLVKSSRWRNWADAFSVEQTMPYPHLHTPNKPQTLYRMVQYFMSLKKKLPYFPNIPACVLTHRWDLQLGGWDLNPCSHPSPLMTAVALSICSVEDFQCLWKLFKDGPNLFQIYQELILSLFFFCLPSLPFF